MGKKNNVKKRGGSNSDAKLPESKIPEDKPPTKVSIIPSATGIIGHIINFFYYVFVIIIGGVIIANILAVLMMCGVMYMMVHFVLVAVNGIIKLITSIFPFLKKKLKPIKVWPHELILDALGIKFDSDDPYTLLNPDDEDQYCPTKKK